MTRTRKIVGGVIAGFLLALIAVIVLITTGVIGFHEDDDKAFEKPEIRPGKYYLELENGYAQDEYIEVFSDQTIAFVGDYWDANAEQDKEEGVKPWNERQTYTMTVPAPWTYFIAVTGEELNTDEGYAVSGVGFDGEDTITATRVGGSGEGDVKYYPQGLNETSYDQAHYVYKG